jgi:hypothetical protein
MHAVKKYQFLQEPHGVTSQKMTFFIVTAVKTSNLTCWKLDLFPFSGEGKEIPTLWGPLERANPNHWITCVI